MIENEKITKIPRATVKKSFLILSYTVTFAAQAEKKK